MKEHLPYKAAVNGTRDVGQGFSASCPGCEASVLGPLHEVYQPFWPLASSCDNRKCLQTLPAKGPPGDETAPSGDRLSRCSAWHTARCVLHNDASCAFCASQPESLEDRTAVDASVSKRVGRGMEPRGKWTDQQMDTRAYLILVVSLTRKIQKSTVTGGVSRAECFWCKCMKFKKPLPGLPWWSSG